MLVFSRKRVQQVCTTLRTLNSNGRALRFSLESAQAIPIFSFLVNP